MFSRRLERLRTATSVRLAAWYAGFFILGTLLLFGLAYVLLATSLRDRDRQLARLEARALANHYDTAGLDGVKRAVAALVPGSFFVRVADPRNGTVFIDRPDQWVRFDVTGLSRGPGVAPDTLITLPGRHDEDVLELVTLRLADGFLLQVGTRSADREAALETFRSTVGWVLGPVAVLGVLGGALLAARALRPIRQLVRTVRTIEAGAMDTRVPTRNTGDELDELSRLFNLMLDRIAALIHGMRSALDNVAHDLRTPVARIRGTAEVALRSEQGHEAWREALADCIDESDQLLTMLNTLMDISEAETGALKLNREPVELAALVADTVELYRPIAEENAIALSATAPAALWLVADRTRLRQVVANLLDNALKYTAHGGRVDVHTGRDGMSVLVTVKDTGIGITPDELPKIWDRLYRGDASRSERGLGLGLSLVKAVVEAHQGRVTVTSTVGAGSVFTIVLPAEPGPEPQFTTR